MPADHLRILIVDDHTLFRRGLRDVIDEALDMEVVAEAADGEQAIELVARLRPGQLDIVLMDIAMPKLDGIAATQRIIAADPSLPVVILTVSEHEDELLASVRAGAAGFLSKALSPEALTRALRDFYYSDALPMSGVMATRVLTHLRSAAAPQLAAPPAGTVAADQSQLQQLSARERQVLQLIARGRHDREIAHALDLTTNTVKKHVKNILQKLGVRNRVQAAAHLIESTHTATDRQSPVR
jgi:two-component system nitrate/nitrite response regulator NarL